jgi:hypothetical protein
MKWLFAVLFLATRATAAPTQSEFENFCANESAIVATIKDAKVRPCASTPVCWRKGLRVVARVDKVFDRSQGGLAAGEDIIALLPLRDWIVPIYQEDIADPRWIDGRIAVLPIDGPLTNELVSQRLVGTSALFVLNHWRPIADHSAEPEPLYGTAYKPTEKWVLEGWATDECARHRLVLGPTVPPPVVTGPWEVPPTANWGAGPSKRKARK